MACLVGGIHCLPTIQERFRAAMLSSRLPDILARGPQAGFHLQLSDCCAAYKTAAAFLDAGGTIGTATQGSVTVSNMPFSKSP